MNLVIDAGNSLLKCAVFDGEKHCTTKFWTYQDELSIPIQQIIQDYPIQKLAIASVAQKKFNILNSIPLKNIQKIEISYQSIFPFEFKHLNYTSVGIDRLIALSAAYQICKSSCLVIDLGTCITYDILDAKKKYQGGAISPGAKTRLLSMHQNTDQLPKIEELSKTINYTEATTVKNMQSGVYFGILAEISDKIQRYQAKFSNLAVFITGGDAKLFVNELNYEIFAEPNLVLKGLNQLIKLNAH